MRHEKVMVHVVIALASKVPETAFGAVAELHSRHVNATCAEFQWIGLVGKDQLVVGECTRERCLAGLGLTAEIDLDAIERRDTGAEQTSVVADLGDLVLVCRAGNST